MPLYTFKCECGEETVLIKYEELESPRWCKKCEYNKERVYNCGKIPLKTIPLVG